MSTETDVIKVAMKVGENVIKVGAKGSPAVVIAIGVAAAMATAATAIGYGGYVGAQKLLGWTDDKPKQLR